MSEISKVNSDTLVIKTTIPEWVKGPKGDDGFSPTIKVHENTSTDYKLEITDVDGSYITPNLKGSGGGGTGGENGATFIPSVSEDGVISWTNDKGYDNPSPVNIKGPAGKDGKNGVDGKEGPIGPQGNPGKDGTNGKDGLPGKEGKPGTNGTNGKDGTNGTDGFSPTIVVKDNTESTYTLTITDKNGSYNTPNLKGSGGGGGTGDNGATFTPSVSPEGIISWENDKGLKNPDPVDIKGPKGDTGDKGADGVNGKDGAPGKDGAEGKQGPQGEQGLPGKEGPQGPAGADGKQGPQGEPGKDGTNGTDGKDGAPGAKGDTGDSGVYRGSVEPVDESVKVWIDPNGTASDNLATEKYVDDAIAAIDIPDTTPIATVEIAGKVKPDGTTITVDEDGTIHGASGGGSGWDLSDRIHSATAPGSIIVSKDKDLTCQSGRNSICCGNLINLTGDVQNSLVLGTFLKDSGNLENSILCGWSNNWRNLGDSMLLGNQNNIGAYISTSAIVGSFNICVGSIYNTLAAGKNLLLGCIGGENKKATLYTGEYNIRDDADAYCVICGNGTGAESLRSNAFTLDRKGNGAFLGTVTSTGADYAEYFEWADGNPNAEDRVGNIVTLDGDKIRYANDGDDILGVVSGTVGVLGDNYEWQWHNKYLTDDFGRVIYDMVEEFDEDPETHEKHSLGMFPHPRINPDYDDSKPYTKRSDRPEWDAVGMMGKLYVKDDGTAKVNDYITACNGIATKAFAKTNMRVMERIKPNIIRVLMR